MILDSFFVSLGFQVDTSGAEKFNAQAAALRETVVALGTVAVGAALGIGALAIGVASSLGDIEKFAELNDVSARSVAAFGKVATDAGSSLDAAKSTIENVNRVVGEAALGFGRGAQTFEKLGLNAKDSNGHVKDFDTVLGEVSNKMQGLSRQEQIALAAKLGIDPTLVRLLGQGGDNLARLREEAEAFVPFSEEQYKLGEEVDKLYSKAKGSVGVFAKIIGASLLPLAKEVLTTYLGWFKASRAATTGVVMQGIQILIGALGTLWDWAMRAVDGFKGLYGAISQIPGISYAAYAALFAIASLKTYQTVNNLIGAFKALRLGIAAFTTTISLPAIVIGGLILAIGLLIDDFVNFKEGNDSLIGSLSQKFPIILDIINAISKGVSELFSFWSGIWAQLKEPVIGLGGALLNLVTTIVSVLWPIAKTIFTALAYVLGAVIPVVAVIVRLFAEDLAAAVQGWVLILAAIVGVVTDVFQSVASVVSTVFDFISGVVGAAINAAIGAVGFIIGVVTTAKNTILGFVDSIGNAISAVSKFFGLTNSKPMVSISAATSASPSASGGSPAATPASFPSAAQFPATAAAIAQAPAAEPAPGAGNTGPLGPQTAAVMPASAPAAGVTTAPASSVNTTTNTTSISGTQITIQSPDPTTAGASVRDELDRMNRQTIRNGQSAVNI